MVLELIIAASVIVSLISFIGVFTLSLNKNILKSLLFVLVAFAAGALLGVGIFDVIPEVFAANASLAPLYIVIGILIFFVVEKFVGWHHHHHGEDIDKVQTQPSAYVNLVTDGVHNFVDGTIIAASFLTNAQLGILATIAIILHEIPQELGDFAVLINSGMKTKKALFYNFLSALTALIGAVVTFYISSSVQALIPLLLSVAGGGFLYLALTDLIPEIHKETDTKKTILQFVFLVIGVFLIYFLVNTGPRV